MNQKKKRHNEKYKKDKKTKEEIFLKIGQKTKEGNLKYKINK